MSQLPSWSEVFRTPQFWQAYYEGHVAVDEEAAGDDEHELTLEPADILARIFPASRPADRDRWRSFDLYNDASSTAATWLRHLARHDHDLERTVAALTRDNELGDHDRLRAKLAGALAHVGALDQRIDLAFADGTIWRIVFTSGPADSHFLVEPGRDDLLLGWTGANFALPILRLPELERMCEVLTASGSVPFEPHWLAPLLHPTVLTTTDDDLHAHRAWLEAAWRATGLADGDPLAELVERTTRPLDDFRWQREPARGWVNDFPHSHRNPRGGWPIEAAGQRFLAEGFDRFDRFATRCLGLPAAALRSV